MNTFKIQGGKKLKGSIAVGGSKNAAGPIIAATVLIKGMSTIHNVPHITDIETMLEILKRMGAAVMWVGDHSLTIDCTHIDPSKIDYSLVSKMRLSILLLGCLASRFGSVTLSVPGGCNIGSRPLDAHFEALEDLGFACEVGTDTYHIEKKNTPKKSIVMKEFSVTATENVLLASVLSRSSLMVRCAAADHVVQDLCWFLEAAGAHIRGIGTHTVAIEGVSTLHGVEYTIMPDPIEVGTFIVLAAATRSEITIRAAAPEFLSMEMRKFEEVGLSFKTEVLGRDSLDHYDLVDITPKKIKSLQAIKKVHTMPYPGFAADLIQPFALLMTQAQGISMLHDWMYDGRLRYVTELQKMGANIAVLDPHRILVVGATPLYAKDITSYDLRAGATLVLAGLMAQGITTITGIDQVDRGYEKLDERLRSLGATIERI